MITLIGDVDQLLYRFNGAKPEILSKEIAEQFPGILTFKMETNYRSTQNIVRFQKDLISYNYGNKGGPYNQNLFKNLIARNNATEGDNILFAEYEDAQEEAESTASEIENLLAQEYNNGDIFVLARTRAQLAFLEGPLTKRKIKFINLTGGSFWGSKHVQDVIAYLKLACNENDDKSFKRVYNIASKWFVHPFGKKEGEYCHHRYLGRAFEEKVNGSYKNVAYAGWRYRNGVQDLQMMIEEIQGIIATSFIEAIDYIVKNCYRQFLQAEEGITSIDESENGKLEDFEIVKEIAMQFDSVQDFFDYVDNMVRQSEEAKNGNLEDYVVISTVHRVKGQERKIIFGVGLSEGFDNKDESPKGLLPHTFSLALPPKFGVLPSPGMGRVEDERCLVFVMVSRAKERIYLSSIQQYRDATLYPSRFIKELGIELEK